MLCLCCWIPNFILMNHSNLVHCQNNRNTPLHMNILNYVDPSTRGRHNVLPFAVRLSIRLSVRHAITPRTFKLWQWNVLGTFSRGWHCMGLNLNVIWLIIWSPGGLSGLSLSQAWPPSHATTSRILKDKYCSYGNEIFWEPSVGGEVVWDWIWLWSDS